MKKFLLILCCCFLVSIAQAAMMTAPDSKTVYDFTVKTIDGNDQDLSVYRGKVLLIVNTASQCGFTPQYKGLEAVYKQFKSQGFEILAFPANNFKGQEPGDNGEIKKFCELRYKTTFPLFSKISVKGDDRAPLYTYLTTQSGFNGDITWNFNKFLVDKKGNVIARFGSDTTPQSEPIISRIQKEISK